MKIGIITFNSAHNCGAVLQAWALQEHLISRGHTVEIINYRIPAIDDLYRLFVPENPYESEKKNKKHQEKQLRTVKKTEPNRLTAFERFECFIAEQLHTTIPYTSWAEIKSVAFDYDALIVGSDQVWNSKLTKRISPTYLLDFGPKNARRIAYAASRGDGAMSNQEKIVFARKLASFDFISVREENMVSSILELTDCEVTVTADPTLLVSREQFNTIRMPYPCEKPYIYVHNVHVKKTDERLCKMAETLSKKTGFPVVTNRKDKFVYSNLLKEATDIGPREFLDAVANAEYVVTNSFHATVFSTIYHKRFVTLPSLHSPERMILLLERLGLSSHLIETPELLPEDLTMLQFDSEDMERRKAEYVKVSKQFLETALHPEYVRTKELSYERSYCRTANPMACYACGACVKEGVPAGTGLVLDKEGFLYPDNKKQLAEDAEERCLQRYGFLSEYDAPVMYSADLPLEDPAKNHYYFNEYQHICKSVLDQGGCVVAKVAPEPKHAEYRILRSKEDLELLYAGCLVEVNAELATACCKEALKEFQTVLFVASACEATSVRMQIADERLVTLVKSCNGVVSGQMWKQYVESLEKKYESGVRDLNYTKLIKGFGQPYAYIGFENDEVILNPASRDLFYRAYTAGALTRPSCFRCVFSENWSRAIDIAVAVHPDNVRNKDSKQMKLLIAAGSEAGMRVLANSGLTLTKTDTNMRSLLSKLSSITTKRLEIAERLETEEIQKVLEEYLKQIDR